MSDSEFPSTGRIAGIDFGTVRIGVAVTDPSRTIASPWDTYQRKNSELDAAYFRRFVEDEGIVGFVVGLPVHMSGDESQKSVEARAFGAWLGSTTGCPVCFFDERFTTSDALRLLAESGRKRRRAKDLKDKLAAQLILSNFLERGGAGRATPLDS